MIQVDEPILLNRFFSWITYEITTDLLFSIYIKIL